MNIRAAYADPPYIGQAKKHYSGDPQCAEVDHQELITRLMSYDAWALSCSSTSLHTIVPMLPKHARFAAWVKPFCSFKPGVNPAYAWEPVIYVPTKRSRYDPTVRDWVAANITLKKGTHGAKPVEFCLWLFDLLGIGKYDTLDDLYPGSGIVTKMWTEKITTETVQLKMEGI